MKGIVFDLELNQPSQSIIEIGAYLVNYKSKVFLAQFQTFCRLPEGERLNPEVAKLCNITEEQVNAGVDRAIAIRAFWKFLEESNCQGNLSCWGNDLEIIREQSRALGVDVPDRICGYNVLAASKRFGIRPGENARRGLRSSLEDVGLPYEGERHRACPDSWNTAKYEFHLLRCIDLYRKSVDFVQNFFQEKALKTKHKGGYLEFLPPDVLENRAGPLLAGLDAVEEKRAIPESFTYKGVNYTTIGPVRMEDSLGNWIDGVSFKNEKDQTFVRSRYSFFGLMDRIEKA